MYQHVVPMKQCSTLIIKVNINGEDEEMTAGDADEISLNSLNPAFLREVLPEFDVRQAVVEDLLRIALLLNK